MDKKEAVALLEAELDRFQSESHEDLVRRIDGEPVVCERRGGSGVIYQIEIQFFWDDRSGGDVRILGAVDDGGWRAFVPITSSRIVSR
jgi:hypothetical protein